MSLPRESPQVENHGIGTHTGYMEQLPGRESTKNKSLKLTIIFNKTCQDCKNIFITKKKRCNFPWNHFPCKCGI